MLKLYYDEPPSNFAFKFNLRCYTMSCVLALTMDNLQAQARTAVVEGALSGGGGGGGGVGGSVAVVRSKWDLPGAGPGGYGSLTADGHGD